ncbi:MAG: hypothetical protein R2847_10135 [Bacteroidia bacterium]
MDYNSVPKDNKYSQMHSADWTVMSVRNGWMPFYPTIQQEQFES